MPIPAPSDKRFRRAHVSPTRKRGRWEMSWKRIAHISVVTAFVGYACYRGVDVLLATDALTVTRITVSGNTKLSRGEVIALLDGMRGRNMVFLNLEDWRRKLTGSPWVADAALRRVLPGTVDVFISERLPMGIARIADALYLIDEQGAIIDEFDPITPTSTCQSSTAFRPRHRTAASWLTRRAQRWPPSSLPRSGITPGWRSVSRRST